MPHQLPLLEDIRQLLEADRLEEALQRMKLLSADETFFTEISMQLGRLSRGAREERLQVVTREEATVDRNRVRRALLDMVAEMDRQVTPIAEQRLKALQTELKEWAGVHIHGSVGGNVKVLNNTTIHGDANINL